MSVESGCQIIYGPMFSGKTTQFCYIITVKSKLGKVLVITCTIDNRGTSEGLHGITTHNKLLNGKFENVDSVSVGVNDLDTVNVDDYPIIAIDEAQFFKGLNPTVRHWVEDLKKYVIVCGLVGD